MPTVQSVVRGTGNLAGTTGADRLVRSVADEIFLMEANAMPLTSLARGVNKIVVPSTKREWFEDEIFPEKVTLNGAVSSTATAGGTDTITVDAPTGNYLAADDLLWNPDPAINELMRVVSVTNSTTVIVERGVGSSVAGHADNSTLVRIGNAMSQGSNTPAYKQTLEVMRTNYIQRFRKAFAVTKEAMHSSVYGEQLIPYQKRKTLLELMREVEYANWFGVASAGDGLVENSNAASRQPNTADGLYEFIRANGTNNIVDVNGELTGSTLRSFIRDVFLNKGPHEPGQKVLFAAPSAISDLEGIPGSMTTGEHMTMNVTPDTTKFGVKVQRWQTTFGEILIVPHPLLADPSGGSENYAFLIDMKEVAQVVQEGMDLTYVERDMENVDGQEVIVGEWKISQCLQVKGSGNGGNGVHGVLTSIAA